MKKLFNESQMESILCQISPGLLVFGSNLVCHSPYPAITQEILGYDPSGKSVVDALEVPKSQQKDFEIWCNLAFQRPDDFKRLKKFAPKVIDRADGKHFSLSFWEVPTTAKSNRQIVVSFSDQSEKIMKKRESAVLQKKANLILEISRSRNYFFMFILSVRQVIAQFRGDRGKIDPSEAMRIMHNLKGVAKSLYLEDFANLLHGLETDLSHKSEKRVTPISFSYYGDRMNLWLNQFFIEYGDFLGDEFELHGGSREVAVKELYGIAMALSHKPENKEILQRFLENLVAVPLQEILRPYNSVIQALAQAQGKWISDIEFRGDEIKLLPELYEGLFSVLIHLFRNSVDHGIERPEEREKSGKNKKGKIIVTTQRKISEELDELVLTIEDDGRGLDLSRLRQKIKSLGREDFNAQIDSDDFVADQVFLQGISTSDFVNEISGRGVGLSSVREEVEKLHGKVKVASKANQGTSFTLRMPLIWRVPLGHRLHLKKISHIAK